MIKEYGKYDIEFMVNKQPPVDAIVIPENATNGDMLKIIFKPYLVTETAYGYHVFLTENDYKTGEWLNYSKIWWNAPYKTEVRNKMCIGDRVKFKTNTT